MLLIEFSKVLNPEIYADEIMLLRTFLDQFVVGMENLDDHEEVNEEILEDGGVKSKANLNILEIFIYYDDLLKYMYSFGERMDRSTRKESYMPYTYYMKLLNNYCFFPSICSQLEAKRTFKVFEFQKGKIDFRGFVSTFCVFANTR